MNETIKNAADVLKAISIEPVKTAVSQRLSNPLFIAFAISWLSFNWHRVLIILFSNAEIEARIKIVFSLPSNFVILGVDIPHAQTLVAPFIVALLFVILTPFASWFIETIQNNVVIKLYFNRVYRKSENLKADSLLIVAQVDNDYAKEFQESKRKADIEEQRLRSFESESTIKNMRSESNSLSMSIDSKRNELNTLEAQVITVREQVTGYQEQLNSITNSINKKHQLLREIEQNEKTKAIRQSTLRAAGMTEEEILSHLNKEDS